MFGFIRKRRVEVAINDRIAEIKRLKKVGLLSHHKATYAIANLKGLKKDLDIWI